MIDTTDIRQNDIVPGAQLHLEVWSMWRSLVEAAATNDADWVFRLGVTENSSYKTPNSEYMSAKNKKLWLADRAFVALFVASHRGHQKLVNKLIEAGMVFLIIRIHNRLGIVYIIFCTVLQY